MPGWVIPVGLTVFVLLWLLGTWNGLIRLRNHCDEAISGVDTELKRRYDLIPNLVETVKGYAAHERDTLAAVLAARNSAVAAHGSPKSQSAIENELVRGVRRLIVLSESYPDLKASRQFLELQRELANTEDRIQSAQRFYNANVRDYNNRVQAFPSNILASMGGFTRREFFEIEDAGMRTVPRVDLGGAV